MRLLETLKHLESEHYISFHMPGHKGGAFLKEYLSDFLKYDITEIPGADNLHAPEACLFETESKISELYGVRKSKILINGSSVGILAMIMGTLSRGDEILINRNAHQSVYHAIELKGLKPRYILPVVDSELDITTEITYASVVEELEKSPNIKACLLTYPTYEGICYPIDKIITELKRRGIIVLIDEAHGAHLNFHSPNHSSALFGVDYIVQSFHKTLPAMTQTACLHFVTPDTTFDERITWHLKALQSSSPSYVLMASIDAMLDVLEKRGKALSSQLECHVAEFYQNVAMLKSLTCKPLFHQEVTKLVVSISDAYFDEVLWNGVELAKLLMNKFKIVAEYSTPKMVLLMTSIATTREDLVVLSQALCSIDIEIQRKSTVKLTSGFIKKKPVAVPMQVYLPSEIDSLDKVTLDITESLGRISAEYITPYPPGIPLAIPGEVIEEPVYEWLRNNKIKITVLR